MDHLENSSDNSLAVLYTISDDPKRREFLDELFDFMVENATPILRVPVMGRQPLDLYELYRQVVDRGGLLRVIRHKLWREIRDTLGLPSTITSAAYTLRTQYWRHLYPFECHKHDFSQPHEVEEAIERNQRDVAPTNDNGSFDPMSAQHPMFPGFSAMQHPSRFLPHPAFFSPSGYFSPYTPYPAFNPPPFGAAGGAGGAGSLPYGYAGPVMPGPSYGLLPNPFAARNDADTARPLSKKKPSATVTSSDDPTLAAGDHSDGVDSVGMARDTRSGNGATVGNVTPADRSTPGSSASTDRSTTGGSLPSAERDASSVENVLPIDLRATGGNVATSAHRSSTVDNGRPVDRESVASGSANRAVAEDSVARPSADSVERSSRDDVDNGASKDNLPSTSGISSNDAASETEADGGAVGGEETRKRPRSEPSPTQENTSSRRQVFSFDLMGWEADTDDGTMVLRLRINGVRYRGLVNLERDDDNDDDGL